MYRHSWWWAHTLLIGTSKSFVPISSRVTVKHSAKNGDKASNPIKFHDGWGDASTALSDLFDATAKATIPAPVIDDVGSHDSSRYEV